MKRISSGLCLILLLLTACSGQASQPSPASSPSPTSVSQTPESFPPEVVEYALSHVSDAASECGFDVTDTQLTGLSLLAEYPLLPGAAVEVYRMEYRLKPADPSKVVLAGGMQLDDQGWLKQTGSPGDPCLVVENASGTYSLLGETWDGELPADAGWEGRLGALLTQWGEDRGDEAMTKAGQLALCRAWLSRADTAMVPFAGAASTEGEPYTDENGHVWLKLTGYEKQGDGRMDDQILGNLYAVFPQELAVSLFDRYVYVTDPVFLEREDGLYVRQDAAELLDWDYTSDLSTLTLDDGAYGEDRLNFTLQGTGHGGSLTWRFSLIRQEGEWKFYRYYSLAAEGWGAPAEFSVLIGGEWFGLESSETPAALGQPAQVEKDPYNTYTDTGFWRTDYYDGIWASRYDDGTESSDYGVVTMEITRAGLPTWRGVSVGDGKDAVAAAYPEAVESTYYLTGDTTVPCLGYQAFPDGPGYLMDFIFDENDKLTQIFIKNEFD